MSKVILIEFSDNTPLQRIYEQLRSYHYQNNFVKTIYKGTILSNEDMIELKETVTRLELGLSKEEYQKYKKHEKEEEERIKLYNTRLQTPSVIKYWIEKTKKILDSDKQEDWEKTCYLLIQKANRREPAEVKQLAIKFVYQTIISAAKIIIALQNESDNIRIDDISKVIDNELSYYDEKSLLDNKYKTIEILVSHLTNKGELYRKLTFYNEVTDNNKYSQPIENPITKKKVPNYLKK